MAVPPALRAAQRHAQVLGDQDDARPPAGGAGSCSQSATCWVSRSWTCGRQANISTTRASFDKPEDPLARQVGDVGAPGERQEMVLAQGAERDAPAR